MIARAGLSKVFTQCRYPVSIKLKHPLSNRFQFFAHQRRYETTSRKPLSVEEVDDLLSTPTWSVNSLIESEPNDAPTETITQKQLHHLLRLSALPLPETPEEEAGMIKTLQSQLYFVRAVRSVDTTGIKPLHAIRDESEEATQAMRFDMKDLQDELDREEIVGFARRLRKKPATGVVQEEETVDVLKLAPNKIGRYVVVNTKKT